MNNIKVKKLLSLMELDLQKQPIEGPSFWQGMRCFWTRPFGHIWGPHKSKSSYDRTCVVCGKNITTDSNLRFDLGYE